MKEEKEKNLQKACICMEHTGQIKKYIYATFAATRPILAV